MGALSDFDRRKLMFYCGGLQKCLKTKILKSNFSGANVGACAFHGLLQCS